MAGQEDLLNEFEDVIELETECSNCYSDCLTKMKKTEIPFFKNVIIMSTSCDICGYKSNEVKSGNGISEKGIKYILKITDPSDMARDILKSEVAYLEIPEIGFMMESGTLGGKFTTIEGILKDCHDQLSSVCSSFCGNSSESSLKMAEFLNKLEQIHSGNLLDVTIVLDDPSGNSYLQNTYAPMEDPNLTVENYDRNFEQNDLLGINDMKTENYGEND